MLRHIRTLIRTTHNSSLISRHNQSQLTNLIIPHMTNRRQQFRQPILLMLQQRLSRITQRINTNRRQMTNIQRRTIRHITRLIRRNPRIIMKRRHQLTNQHLQSIRSISSRQSLTRRIQLISRNVRPHTTTLQQPDRMINVRRTSQ